MNDGKLRDVMKSTFGAAESGWVSDQQKGKPHPQLQQPVPEGAAVIPLPDVGPDTEVAVFDFPSLVAVRRSCRVFADDPLTLQELAFLLWATAGVHQVVGDGYCTLRSVPSAGARHPFETYLAVRSVEELEDGVVYRYLPLDHALMFCRRVDDLPARASKAALDQRFVGRAAVTFFWACVPYRAEWRYGSRSYKAALLDAGHIAQNLYLAAEAIDCGTCAIAAYDQGLCDELLGLDGQDEFTVYLSPVGRHKGADR